MNHTVRKIAVILLFLGHPSAASDPAPDSQPSDTTEIPAEDAPTYNFLGLEAAPIDDTLVTDRPDFTESTLTIPYGRVQLEAGYTYVYDSGDGVRSQAHTYPEMLFRIGLVEDVELRLGWVGWEHTEEVFRTRNDVGRTVGVRDRSDGGGDMDIGFKFHLLDQDGWVPDFGIIVNASIPTGSDAHSSGDVDPGLILLWAYDLTDEFAVAGNVNFAVPTSENGRYFETSTSLSFGYSITDKLGTYVEYFGFYPSDRNQADTHFINGGFTYLITNNFQLDVRVGMGLNDEADDLFTGAGFSWRF
ncbi:MAG: transporter [Phycisphaerales bacterium]|nr:transporter [Phycisphaerales bacterium]